MEQKPIPPTLGGKVIIESSDPDIWKDNESHRNLYSGALFTIVSSDTALLAEIPKKEIKKSNPVPDTVVTPKKKKNFFQRLFGKKKNK